MKWRSINVSEEDILKERAQQIVEDLTEGEQPAKVEAVIYYFAAESIKGILGLS